MKNRQTLSAVLLTALIAALAYVGISRGPVARQASPAGLALGQAPTTPPVRLAKPPAVAMPVPVAANDPFPFRLKNTDAPIGELVRNETALLLRNAFIDTALGSGLTIPAEFKTTGDPLTYIAQARGPATAAFRRHIAASGGKIISYIPNNAYLVRVDADWRVASGQLVRHAVGAAVRAVLQTGDETARDGRYRPTTAGRGVDKRGAVSAQRASRGKAPSQARCRGVVAGSHSVRSQARGPRARRQTGRLGPVSQRCRDLSDIDHVDWPTTSRGRVWVSRCSLPSPPPTAR